jgi:hypothetical protein
MGLLEKARGDNVLDLRRMKISEALDEFDSQRNKKFSARDREKIQQVVQELGLSSFALKFRDDNGALVYIFDLNGDVLHVHATMLVARRTFSGATNRGAKPYEFHRYHFPLSKWADS